jgi:hypothetical protein
VQIKLMADTCLVIFLWHNRSNESQDRHIWGFQITQSDTPQLVVAEISAWKHTTDTHAHRQIFFFCSLVLSSYFIRICFCLLLVLNVCLFSLLYNTHNTNIHVSGGIRMPYTIKRAAADPRPRTFGHWDRHLSSFLSQVLRQAHFFTV